MFKQWRINRIKIKMAGINAQIDTIDGFESIPYPLLLDLKKEQAELNTKLTILKQEA